MQNPLDMWMYQELLWQDRPSRVLQTGVSGGGSILFFAHMLDAIGATPDALVIGVDLYLSDEARTLVHPRIRLVAGDSIAAKTVDRVEELIPDDNAFVILDSDHSRNHVLEELQVYSRFVGPNMHMVVEDTNIYGHPVSPLSGPGPHEAVDDFLRQTSSFVRDDVWKRNLISFHSDGWLRRTQ